MTKTFLNPSELIPGYTTVDRLGGGGYGEVWRVKAPGGLDKAIKVVYGYINEERASRELKALNRIKEIRHPFLISLERIEIVANQLLIVTELADCSLIEQFDQCREQGMEGIPRDDLIQFLKDAAAALDYMQVKNSLQHLDIKPENLLLVGGRIKVADFGLVKDVSDIANSTVLGGLTPVYASPEVFEGAASPQSDQYSLAIVYQHMLTGILPFPGRTQQQLSIQHKQASPRLSSLPESDRNAVARALLKQPTERFPSCEAFVDALANGVRSTVVRHRTTRSVDPPSREQDTTSQKGAETTLAPSQDRPGTDVYKTEQLDQQINKTKLRELAKSLAGDTPAVPVTTEIREHGPIQPSEVVGEVRPTMFIGVGGTASRVMQRLKANLLEWDAFEQSDSVQLLFLDTDPETIKAVREGMHGAPLERDEAVCLSLRRPREYQERSAQLMRWISRRWLYNIPRSLKPQGYRPLGRLAWVDHVERVHVSLRDKLARLVNEDSIKALEDASGLPCNNRSPRIFLVGSTSGGTGGGILLDAIQAVRFLLAEQGIPHDGIASLLTYSTNGHPRESTLAVANTYAFLSELQHLAKMPGDDAIDPRIIGTGLSPVPPTYFVNLGEHLGDDGFDERSTDLGDYLFFNVATPAASLLDHCRAETDTMVGHDVKLRSIGLASLESASSDLPIHWAKLLCQSVLYRWLNFDDERNPEQPQLEEMITEGFNDLVPSHFVGCLTRHINENFIDVLKDPRKPTKELDLTPLDPLIKNAGTQLRELIDYFDLPKAEGAILPHENAPDLERRSAAALSRLGRNLDRQLRRTIPLLADDIAEALLPKFLGSGSLSADGSSVLFQSLSTILCSTAHEAIAKAVQEVDKEHIVDDQGCLRPTSAKLNECFDTALIGLPGCGMTRRLFVLDRAQSQWLEEEPVCQNATKLIGTVDQTFICQEIEEVSLAQLAHVLADERPEIVEAAIRLHTRTDVKWSYPAPICTTDEAAEAEDQE